VLKTENMGGGKEGGGGGCLRLATMEEAHHQISDEEYNLPLSWLTETQRSSHDTTHILHSGTQQSKPTKLAGYVACDRERSKVLGQKPGGHHSEYTG